MASEKNGDDKAKQDIEKNLEWLSDVLIAQDENGLFDINSVTTKFAEIQNALDKARKEFGNVTTDFSDVQTSVEKCWNLMNGSINQAPPGYRNRYVHVRPFASILGIVFLGSVVALSFRGDSIWFAGVPYWAPLIGCLGGSLRGLWWLFRHISRKDFRKTWWFWFIVSPLIGTGLGIFTYFAVLAGVAATTSSATISQSGLTMFLVGFAGFNWNWALQVLEGLAETKSGTSSATRP